MGQPDYSRVHCLAPEREPGLLVRAASYTAAVLLLGIGGGVVAATYDYWNQYDPDLSRSERRQIERRNHNDSPRRVTIRFVIGSIAGAGFTVITIVGYEVRRRGGTDRGGEEP